MADLAKTAWDRRDLALGERSRPFPGSPVAAFLFLWGSLNAPAINDLAPGAAYTYCDYAPALRGHADRMKGGFSRRGLHPTLRPYTAMAPLLLAASTRRLKSHDAHNQR